jgi:hypothetical protein
VTFVFLIGWHNSNGSYSFDGKKLNVKKNVNLNFIFASTANVKPLTANRGLRLGVNKINVNLKVSMSFEMCLYLSLWARGSPSLVLSSLSFELC